MVLFALLLLPSLAFAARQKKIPSPDEGIAEKTANLVVALSEDDSVIENAKAWYVADAGKSCDHVCGANDLRCHSDSFFARRWDVDSEDEVQSLVSAAGLKCDRFIWGYQYEKDVPQWKTDGTCLMSSVYRNKESISCSEAPPNDARRLCYCGADVRPILGSKGANWCPAGSVRMTEQQCKKAAGSYWLSPPGRFRGSHWFTHVPAGCSGYYNSGSVAGATTYDLEFNWHPSGGGSGARHPVCIKAPPAKPAPATKCFKTDKKYEPLDMVIGGRGPRRAGKSAETSLSGCQDRCMSFYGCRHFSYWPNGDCWLQDSNAREVDAEVGVRAGPPDCEACFEKGVTYEPLNILGKMRGVSPGRCQIWCANSRKCRTFSYWYHFGSSSEDEELDRKGDCYLQDETATRKDGWPGFSGQPQGCKDDV